MRLVSGPGAPLEVVVRRSDVDRVRARPVDPLVPRVERTRALEAKEKPLRRVLSSSLCLCSRAPRLVPRGIRPLLVRGVPRLS